MTVYNSFPITGRKTSEFSLETQLPTGTNLVFWSGVAEENLDRIGIEDFVNEALKYITSAAETLSADKEIDAGDTFVQILVSGASTRVITVANGISCFVHNSAASANIITVEGTDLAAGESCFVFWDGTSAHTVVKLAASGGGGGGGTEFLTITLSDMTNATYYYYGGTNGDGDWQINRFTKASLSTKVVATESNNGSYGNLAAAWTDRTSLTYA